ncbi:class I SAM-dependent methyltransferase [Nonomuraea sp. NPDC003560]|uniref:class I SAM-dependent methyltransferase n=1 Tax=Nonomuraea sp. NPDC003560 TaxID=3364341 RepID=UPI0036B67B36
MTVTREVLAYYAQDLEHVRLREGRGRLEFWRTQDVLRRTLPPPPARVLDVGGGTGVHAEWLLADGYEVDLLDPVPLHVERAARVPGLRARVGDARRLPVPDGRADAVLLLGPLHHLADRADRLRALGEARRAVRPGGVTRTAGPCSWTPSARWSRSPRSWAPAGTC